MGIDEIEMQDDPNYFAQIRDYIGVDKSDRKFRDTINNLKENK